MTRIVGPLYRIHQTKLSAMHFGKDGRSRFDDPQNGYGVLYAALKPEAAFAECFLRQLRWMLIEEKALAERALSLVTVTPIFCVNLTGHGLRRLSCDNRISDELPYDTPREWSRAVFEHPQKPGGILYRSRHNPPLTCVAIFSSFEKRLRLKKTTPLMGPELRAWTGKLISRYRMALISQG